MRIAPPPPDGMATPKLWLRLAVDVALSVLGLSLMGTAWRTSALPLAVIALVFVVPVGVDAVSSAAALVRRMVNRSDR